MTNPASSELMLRWRMLKDRLAQHMVAVGGIGVIVAIVLIAVYLVYVVLPMFEPATINKVASYALPASDTEPVYFSIEEQAEIGMLLDRNGKLVFFNTVDGTPVKEVRLAVPEGRTVTSLGRSDPTTGVLALGLSDGSALVFRHAYRISYPDDKRLITPVVEYPLGEKPIVVDPDGLPLLKLAIQLDEEQATLAAVTEAETLPIVHLAKEESLLEETVTWQSLYTHIPRPRDEVAFLLVGKLQRDLFVATDAGELSFYNISDWEEAPELLQKVSLVSQPATLTSLTFLAGDISLLAGASDGDIVQWFPVRDENGKRVLTRIRDFDDFKTPVNTIVQEQERKGFLATDRTGKVGLFHTTAHRTLLVESVSDKPILQAALAPRSNAMLLRDRDQIHFYKIHNEYPEVSWSSLWGKVWYESYPEPEYVWQSSSASNDFEPKLSLIPISFGTLKAAFYAMLIAMPLAIMGAIFTAHFMSPRLRQVVKPTIEIMEALPTVILGFLAGLWLAPFVENNLPGIFTLLIVMPFGLLFAAWSWHFLPAAVRHRIPDGWEAALLVPVIILLAYVSIEASPWLETSLFGGDIRVWLKQELGINYDQRNSIVVGLAMGFAVIPTIFSITEDAIFAVPSHLVRGSLALGATPWQTMMRVVLLTASPGIFSAVMIGLGRAVGETMIVLMATGNTPVMDFNIFEGMRTLSANIAVEMPESEVGSTHYRVLFLAALVLFAFTFMVNTLAEIVRQRLRKRYSNL
ncbi:MAG: ABC transporter permease subunit [Proteobacteria bacterium]|nr:ABC transporter permease subunit [Pseudomonadota bacterium]